MDNNEQSEQELADKILPLIKEQIALDEKRRCGVTLEKNQYIGDRTRQIEKDINSLKSAKPSTNED